MRIGNIDLALSAGVGCAASAGDGEERFFVHALSMIARHVDVELCVGVWFVRRP